MFVGNTVYQSLEKLQNIPPEQKLDLSKWQGRKVCKKWGDLCLGFHLNTVAITNLALSIFGSILFLCSYFPLSLWTRTMMVMIPAVLSPLNPPGIIVAIFNAFAASLASQPLPLSIRIGMIALPALFTCVSYYLNLYRSRCSDNTEILLDIIGKESLDFIGKEPFDSLKTVDINLPDFVEYFSMLDVIPYDTCLSKNIFLLNANIKTDIPSRAKRRFLVIPYTKEYTYSHRYFAIAIEIGRFTSSEDAVSIGTGNQNGECTHDIYLSILDKITIEQAQILKILIATGKCEYDPLNLTNGKITLGNQQKTSS